MCEPCELFGFNVGDFVVGPLSDFDASGARLNQHRVERQHAGLQPQRRRRCPKRPPNNIKRNRQTLLRSKRLPLQARERRRPRCSEHHDRRSERQEAPGGGGRHPRRAEASGHPGHEGSASFADPDEGPPRPTRAAYIPRTSVCTHARAFMDRYGTRACNVQLMQLLLSWCTWATIIYMSICHCVRTRVCTCMCGFINE